MLDSLARAGLTIRQARAGDLAGITGLLNADGRSGTFPSARHIPESIRRKIDGEDENVLRLVATIQGDIVGQAALTYGFEPEPASCRLTIIVLKDLRGRGIGTALLENLLREADAQGLKRIELTVFVENRAAIRLYRHFGFEEEARQSGECDVLLMAKDTQVTCELKQMTCELKAGREG